MTLALDGKEAYTDVGKIGGVCDTGKILKNVLLQGKSNDVILWKELTQEIRAYGLVSFFQIDVFILRLIVLNFSFQTLKC